jgi:hypothetical protein
LEIKDVFIFVGLAIMLIFVVVIVAYAQESDTVGFAIPTFHNSISQNLL